MPAQARSRASDLLLRGGTPADDASCLALFNEVFRCDVKGAYWEWKYRQFPGTPIVSVAEDAAGRLIGHTAILPVAVNLAGRKIPGGHCVDSFVSEAYRDKGIYLSLIDHNYKEAERVGIEAYYGFPTATALAIKVAKLGFHEAGRLGQYRLRLDIGRELASRTKLSWVGALGNGLYRPWRSFRHGNVVRTLRRAVGEVSLLRSARVPHEYEAFWNAYAAEGPLCLWKDTEYLRWRYDRNPKGGFEYFWLARGSKVVAFAVAARHGEEARLCELLVTGKDVTLARYLVGSVTTEMAADRNLRRLTFDGFDQGFFAQVFSPWGGNAYFTGAFATKWRSAGPAPEAWSLTLGDGDSY